MREDRRIERRTSGWSTQNGPQVRAWKFFPNDRIVDVRERFHQIVPYDEFVGIAIHSMSRHWWRGVPEIGLEGTDLVKVGFMLHNVE